VTELVTGIDLVAEQLRVAAGEALATERVESEGHAVEARLYAEDPRTFLPQAGRIERLHLPGDTPSLGRGDGLRIDAGIEEGDEVGLAYDPLLAKLVAHGRDRAQALDLLADALAETEVAGLTTNLPFLRWLVAHPVVRAGEATTAFLTEHPPLSPAPLRRPARPWRHPWRLNLPAPPPAPPPAADGPVQLAAPEEGAARVTAPMPGTVIRVEVEPCPPGRRSSCSKR
jgi:acetyl/propionyl-CoA carboxylase alpha subunit